MNMDINVVEQEIISNLDNWFNNKEKMILPEKWNFVTASANNHYNVLMWWYLHQKELSQYSPYSNTNFNIKNEIFRTNNFFSLEKNRKDAVMYAIENNANKSLNFWARYWNELSDSKSWPMIAVISEKYKVLHVGDKIINFIDYCYNKLINNDLDLYNLISIDFLIEKASLYSEIRLLDCLYSKYDKEMFIKSMSIDLLCMSKTNTSTSKTITLDWWLNHFNKNELDQMYTHLAIDNGDLESVKWFYSNRDKITFKYSIRMMHHASMTDNIDLLNLFLSMKEKGFILQYDNTIVDETSYTCHYESLKWWLESKLELKHSVLSIDNLFIHKPITKNNFKPNISKILDLWLEHPELIKFSDNALINCHKNFPQLLNKLLEHLIKNNIKIQSEEFVDNLSINNDVQTLQYIYDHRENIGFIYSTNSIDKNKHSLDTLEWWFAHENELELKYTEKSTESISAILLDFWIKNPTKVKYNENVFKRIYMLKDDEMASKWFNMCIQNHLPFIIPSSDLYKNAITNYIKSIIPGFVSDILEIEYKKYHMVDSEDECSICISNQNPDDLIITKCNHIFHLDCLKQWFNFNNNCSHNCPYCKQQISLVYNCPDFIYI
jgi:hypothetical protein